MILSEEITVNKIFMGRGGLGCRLGLGYVGGYARHESTSTNSSHSLYLRVISYFVQAKETLLRQPHVQAKNNT